MTDTDGYPLAGIHVEILIDSGEDGQSVATTTTDASGVYTVDKLATSAFKNVAVISDPTGRHLSEYPYFKVVAGKTVTVDATLNDAGIIQGKLPAPTASLRPR